MKKLLQNKNIYLFTIGIIFVASSLNYGDNKQKELEKRITDLEKRVHDDGAPLGRGPSLNFSTGRPDNNYVFYQLLSSGRRGKPCSVTFRRAFFLCSI